MGEVTFGQYALPVVLMLLLSIAFKFVPTVQDRWKSLVALLAGLGLGMLAILYQGLPWTVVNVVDFGLYGLVQGAAATGLYEVTRAVARPRG